MQMCEKRIVHTGLHAYRVVRGQTKEEMETKASLQLAQWNARWQHKVKVGQKIANDNAGRILALERTKELESQRTALENLLSGISSTDTTLDWESLKRRDPFSTPPPAQPVLRNLPPSPTPLPQPKPLPVPMVYPVIPVVSEWTLLERAIPILRKKKEIQAQELTQRRTRETEVLNAGEQKKLFDAIKQRQQNEIAFQTSKEKNHYDCEAVDGHNEKLNSLYYKHIETWKVAKTQFERERDSYNADIDSFKNRYFSKDQDAIKSYFYEVLGHSAYPDAFPKENTIEITPDRMLIIDFELPHIQCLSPLKEVKYVVARGSFLDVQVSDAWLKKTFDEVLYKICLRTVYEIFRADTVDAVQVIVFNGWVRSIDRAIGSETHACIMSLEAGKDEFLAINLEHVEPKSCFKRLKGVSASKLAELSPIKPLVVLNREDARFVEGYGVVDSVDERTNLAAMDWLDFENLIREVFEKEFSKGGGEVKITQASRDGGVDAVAFDPDPIRGGKIVIQAKRYTNTVGVSAVRDLYGTVHNEGANKGILVTTSDYGPDAYAFAKDKPLTLISGGELLFLLAQHGHSAKIDLAEAKRMALKNV